MNSSTNGFDPEKTNKEVCFKFCNNQFEWFLLEDINRYNSGTGFSIDNSVVSSFSPKNLKFLYSASCNKLYIDKETDRNESSLISGEKKKILKKVKKIYNSLPPNSENYAGSRFDKLSAMTARKKNNIHITMAYHELNNVKKIQQEVIFVLHKNQHEKLKKIGKEEFENNFKLNINKKT